MDGPKLLCFFCADKKFQTIAKKIVLNSSQCWKVLAITIFQPYVFHMKPNNEKICLNNLLSNFN
jgi:hypothetical protein